MNRFNTEYEALSLLKDGNISAFNFLYDKYYQAVYANIFKFVKNESIAEDILQEVFLGLWENKTIIKTDILVGGWLFVVSYNKAIAFLKKQLRESITMSEVQHQKKYEHQQNEFDETNYQRMMAILEEAISQLPKKKQEVFRLCKYQHKKPEEISQELGLTVVSVKDYIKQSTKLIKQYIQTNYTVETSV